MMVISDIFLVQSVRVLSHLQCTTLQLQRNLFDKSKVCQDNHNEGIFPFDFTDLFLTPLNMYLPYLHLYRTLSTMQWKSLNVIFVMHNYFKGKLFLKTHTKDTKPTAIENLCFTFVQQYPLPSCSPKSQ